MANKFYLRTVATLRELYTITDVCRYVEELLTSNGDSPEIIQGGIHIYPITVIPGDTPINWWRPYAPPKEQAIAAPTQDQAAFVPTHKHLKTGGMYQLIGCGVHTEDQQDVAIYRGTDGRIWVRPKDMFDDGRFEPL